MKSNNIDNGLQSYDQVINSFTLISPCFAIASATEFESRPLLMIERFFPIDCRIPYEVELKAHVHGPPSEEVAHFTALVESNSMIMFLPRNWLFNREILMDGQNFCIVNLHKRYVRGEKAHKVTIVVTKDPFNGWAIVYEVDRRIDIPFKAVMMRGYPYGRWIRTWALFCKITMKTTIPHQTIRVSLDVTRREWERRLYQPKFHHSSLRSTRSCRSLGALSKMRALRSFHTVHETIKNMATHIFLNEGLDKGWCYCSNSSFKESGETHDKPHKFNHHCHSWNENEQLTIRWVVSSGS